MAETDKYLMPLKPESAGLGSGELQGLKVLKKAVKRERQWPECELVHSLLQHMK